MRAHWRRLANTIELVHPSAHWSPQPKRQMDRFNRFCTAYGTKCLYFTMGSPIHQKCPFPQGIWTSHVTHDALSPQPKRHLDRSAVFAQMTAECPYMVCLFPPENCLFPCWHLDSGSHVIHGSLGPPKSGTQMATSSFHCQPFLRGSLV